MAYLPKSLRDRVVRTHDSSPVPRVMAARTRDPAELDAVARANNAPELQVPWSMRVFAAWSWRAIVILALVAVVMLLLVQLKNVVIPVLVAVVLTVLLHPMSDGMRRVLRFPPLIASLTTVFLTVGFVVLLLSVASRSIYTGFSDLASKAGAGFQSLLDWLATGPLGIDQAQIDSWLDQLTGALQGNSSVLASGALSITTSIGNIAAGTAVVLFLTIFFLKDGRQLWIWCVRLLPQVWRGPMHEGSIRGWVTLRGYAKSTILVALIDAIGIGVGAALLGVPLALPLALLVFLGAFIPIVGAFLTGTIAVLVALVDKGVVTALLMFAVVILVQQIEGNVLQPWIMSSNVAMHPVAVVLGVAGGTYIAGITGAVFAVPIMAFLNTVGLYLSGHDTVPALATSPTRPGGPPGTLDSQVRASYGYTDEESPKADDDAAGTRGAAAASDGGESEEATAPGKE
ncbi:MAG: AI-2E family transporter [Actinomycetota bacterium]